jgi:hypothetical protein
MAKKIRNYLKNKIKNWFKNFKIQFLKRPIRNTFSLIISIILIYIMGHIIYFLLGFIALIGYFFTCLYGLIKIINKPWRLIIWAVGYTLITIAISLFFIYLYPDFNKKITSFSLSFLFTFIIILLLLLQGLKLKKY